MNLTKECSKCFQFKPLTEFRKQSASKDGLTYYCLSCIRPLNRAAQKKHYQENHNIHITRIRNWQKAHPEKLRVYRNKPIARLRTNVRKRLTNLLKKIQFNKSGYSCAKDIGCSVPELKLWIETRFRNEMSWDNYGLLWQVDHIKPLCKFDLTDALQRKQATHYTNLQPLLIKENRSKGGNY